MTDEPTSTEASGTGEEGFDAPALFYLEHREDIERWAGLRSKAVEATSTFLRDVVAASLDGIAGDADLVVRPFDGLNQHSGAFLHRAGAPIVDDEPVLSICFAWPTASVVIGDTRKAPFVGVYASAAASEGEPSPRSRFTEVAGPVREQMGWSGRGSRYWPVWSWIADGGDWWSDLDAYAARTSSELSMAIHAFQPWIDRVQAQTT